jgi:predicted CXXCH cytochrome family protein
MPAFRTGRPLSAAWIGIILVFILLLPPTGARAQISAPKNPKSAKACALCHYRWIDTFFVEGRGTDLVPYQARKVVATPEMCDSCHDGSIMDSRARMTIGRGHKTDMAPPQAMTIPEIFPLDENGKVQCATCHTAHGVPSGGGAETTIFMRTSNKDSAMCRMCHSGMDSSRADLNHPMGTVKRPIPRDFLKLSTAAGKRADNITCETCHTGHGSTHNALLIKSSRNAGLCLACHTDKAMLDAQGRKKAGHVVNARPVSATIPETLLEGGAKVGPAGEVICNTCHRVHGRQTGQHLLIMEDDQKATLCLACHSDKQGLAGTGHNLIQSAPRVVNLQGQSAVQAGICSACHLPHKPARELAPGGDYTTGMCLSCHGKGQFAASPRIFGSSHPLGVTPYDPPAAGDLYTPAKAAKGRLSLPLFDLYGVPSDSGKVTCATCHDPHRRQVRNGSPLSKSNQDKPKNLFLRQTQPDLCKQCHQDKYAVAETKHNLLNSAPRELNLLKQTPGEAGLCGSCHLVHGGEGAFLWAKKAQPSGDLRNPAACFSCHSDTTP